MTRESSRSAIGKAYRVLARKYHPDVQGPEVSKEDAEKDFRRIATAYEILSDNAAREDYDYMVDNPEEMYMHYYRYYRRRTAPNVDIRLILAVMVSIISGIQYYTAWDRYETAIKYFATVQKYRIHATEIAKKEGLFNESTNKKGKMDKSKEKEEKEKIIRKVIEEKMDIRGVYSKPDWKQILWFQIIILPYTIYLYVRWYIVWIYKFNIRKEEYGEEEKLYLIMKNLKHSRLEFDALEDHIREEYLELELWIKPNAIKWKAEKEEELKRELAQNSRHKAYRRYMKKGTNRLTFDDS